VRRRRGNVRGDLNDHVVREHQRLPPRRHAPRQHHGALSRTMMLCCLLDVRLVIYGTVYIYNTYIKRNPTKLGS